ncbi:hypothetical protein [Paenibacillus sp. L3-i20]|uniref:hypothetical protein n=1 Tax=Paenibacillus sp. L3-i20 TaxID=2905833 RepID=UPI001EE12BE0|nr:hypothetical protein [Paenibacillus sp. L3-i20]GKU79799.1 hypothetical protein L3i20_v241960 [Paenibacillus sp. L3-i20]
MTSKASEKSCKERMELKIYGRIYFVTKLNTEEHGGINVLDKLKLLHEIDLLLIECTGKQEKHHVDSSKWHRAGGQISVLNNLKGKIERGRFNMNTD